MKRVIIIICIGAAHFVISFLTLAAGIAESINREATNYTIGFRINNGTIRIILL